MDPSHNFDLKWWRRHFSAKTEPSLAWDSSERLSAAERAIVASSVPQFQLGEGSDGRGLIRRAHQAGGEELAVSLRAFTAEEQRHSAMLARFLAREGIPLLSHHWSDRVFRKLRKLAGFELCMRVLAVAEVIAVPYYKALRHATQSALMREICGRILEDEEEHLQFQSACQGRFGTANWFANELQFALLAGTLTVVWFQHRAVLTAGGYSWKRFALECATVLERLHRDAKECSAFRQKRVMGRVLAPPSGY